jgi:hypothetical protein
MKRSVASTVAVLFAAGALYAGPCAAASGGTPGGAPAAVLGVLGHAVAPAELGHQRARGIAINVTGSGSALNAATSSANAIIASPVTGYITNDHSIDNNAGITSVLQNFGNNAVMQVSTTININVH